MSAQPFYHRATVLFTGTEPISEQDFLNLLKWLSGRVLLKRIVPESIQIEEYADPEPGDPADL